MNFKVIQRLDTTLRAANPAIVSVVVGTFGVSGSVRIIPPEEQAPVQSVIDAFDWAQPAQDTWENLQARTQAIALLSTPEGTYKLIRALADVIKDEINTLRAVVIGQASQVWDAPNMANATGATSPAFTVTGAAFGDQVDVSCSISFGGLVAFGYVSAANTVVIRLHNGTGGAVNPASATYTVTVRRDVPLAARTLAQLRTAIENRISSGAVDT